MNDEYVVWLLIAALCGVATLLWLLYGRLPRREDDVSVDEMAAESAWISEALAEAGNRVDPDSVEQVLRLHRRYLAGVIPAREPSDPGWPIREPASPATATSEGAPAESAPADSLAGADVPMPDDDEPPAAEPVRSAAHDPAMKRDRARREAPEANLRQPG